MTLAEKPFWSLCRSKHSLTMEWKRLQFQLVPPWKWGPAYDGSVLFSTSPNGTVRQVTTPLLLQKMFNQDATFIWTSAA